MSNQKDETFLTNREILRDIHSKTNEMYSEVMGNPNAGRLGHGQRLAQIEELGLPTFVDKIEKHQTSIEQYKADRIKVLAGVVVLTTVLIGIWEIIKLVYHG